MCHADNGARIVRAECATSEFATVVEILMHKIWEATKAADCVCCCLDRTFRCINDYLMNVKALFHYAIISFLFCDFYWFRNHTSSLDDLCEDVLRQLSFWWVSTQIDFLDSGLLLIALQLFFPTKKCIVCEWGGTQNSSYHTSETKEMGVDIHGNGFTIATWLRQARTAFN